MPNPSAFVAHAREVIAKATPGPVEVDRLGVLRAGPMNEFTNGAGRAQLAMVLAVCLGDHDSGDSMMARRDADTERLALAVNSLAALCDVVEALAVFRRANDEAWQTLSEGPGGTAIEAAAEAYLAESEAALDAALAKLEVPHV